MYLIIVRVNNITKLKPKTNTNHRDKYIYKNLLAMLGCVTTKEKTIQHQHNINTIAFELETNILNSIKK